MGITEQMWYEFLRKMDENHSAGSYGMARNITEDEKKNFRYFVYYFSRENKWLHAVREE